MLDEAFGFEVRYRPLGPQKRPRAVGAAGGMAPKGALSMQYDGTQPAHKDGQGPSQQEVERWILTELMADEGSSIWIREELAHEYPEAGVVFEDALAGLARSDVIHTYGPFVKLSRAAMRTGQVTEILG